jgi:hypothetical protein
MSGSIRAHCASVSTAERDMGQPSRPNPAFFGRHALGAVPGRWSSMPPPHPVTHKVRPLHLCQPWRRQARAVGSRPSPTSEFAARRCRGAPPAVVIGCAVIRRAEVTWTLARVGSGNRATYAVLITGGAPRAARSGTSAITRQAVHVAFHRRSTRSPANYTLGGSQQARWRGSSKSQAAVSHSRAKRSRTLFNFARRTIGQGQRAPRSCSAPSMNSSPPRALFRRLSTASRNHFSSSMSSSAACCSTYSSLPHASSYSALAGP